MIRKFFAFLCLCGIGYIALDVVPVEGLNKLAVQSGIFSLAIDMEKTHVNMINDGYRNVMSTLSIIREIYSGLEEKGLIASDINVRNAVRDLSFFLSKNGDYYKTKEKTDDFCALLNEVMIKMKKNDEKIQFRNLVIKNAINQKNNEPYYYIDVK